MNVVDGVLGVAKSAKSSGVGDWKSWPDCV